LSSSSNTRDLWRFPTFLLWQIFFIVGLMPEPFYDRFRELGRVFPQRALVNSPHFVTLALAAFVAAFCFYRCLAAGATVRTAQDKALEFGILGLGAFVRVDFLMVLSLHLSGEATAQDRWLAYGMVAAKLFCWLYLFSVFIRYYAFSDDKVFAELGSIFPSARHHTLPLAATPDTGAPNETKPAEIAEEHPAESKSGKVVSP
jgi:hypothetical protein